uniref:Uncharacterized protein n=1 Tax=Timema cristinae TaxID=61476 RepID=A0A7R9GSB7_TIMCR|nr:unnamed protein product [Timema cristinae]
MPAGVTSSTSITHTFILFFLEKHKHVRLVRRPLRSNGPAARFNGEKLYLRSHSINTVAKYLRCQLCLKVVCWRKKKLLVKSPLSVVSQSGVLGWCAGVRRSYWPDILALSFVSRWCAEVSRRYWPDILALSYVSKWCAGVRRRSYWPNLLPLLCLKVVCWGKKELLAKSPPPVVSQGGVLSILRRKLHGNVSPVKGAINNESEYVDSELVNEMLLLETPDIACSQESVPHETKQQPSTSSIPKNKETPQRDTTNIYKRKKLGKQSVDDQFLEIEKAKLKIFAESDKMKEDIMLNPSVRTYRITSVLEVLIDKTLQSSVQAESKRDYLGFVSKKEISSQFIFKRERERDSTGHRDVTCLDKFPSQQQTKEQLASEKAATPIKEGIFCEICSQKSYDRGNEGREITS